MFIDKLHTDKNKHGGTSGQTDLTEMNWEDDCGCSQMVTELVSQGS